VRVCVYASHVTSAACRHIRRPQADWIQAERERSAKALLTPDVCGWTRDRLISLPFTVLKAMCVAFGLPVPYQSSAVQQALIAAGVLNTDHPREALYAAFYAKRQEAWRALAVDLAALHAEFSRQRATMDRKAEAVAAASQRDVEVPVAITEFVDLLQQFSGLRDQIDAADFAVLEEDIHWRVASTLDDAEGGVQALTGEVSLEALLLCAAAAAGPSAAYSNCRATTFERLRLRTS